MTNRPTRTEGRGRRGAFEAVLSPRAAGVLRGVVAGFLNSGGPVGSAAVLRSTRLAVSPATVRVVMNELTVAGLLEQPHASAGRVPTLAGLRIYLDHLMPVRSPSAEARDDLDCALRAAGDEPDALVRAASRHLATTCTRTAVGRRPRFDDARVARLELVPLGEARVLAVVLLEDGGVRDRVVRFDGGRAELQRAQNLFNGRFAGVPLSEVRARLARDLAQAEDDGDPEGSLLRLAERALPPEESIEDAVFVAGRTHLLTDGDGADRVGGVMRTLEDKQLLLQLLDDLTVPDGPRVIFGADTEVEALSGCTLVTASFGVEGRRMGAVAILGPVRMDYARIVPWVDYTAHAISGMLGRAGAA